MLDLMLLAVRIVLGSVFVYHGLQKYSGGFVPFIKSLTWDDWRGDYLGRSARTFELLGGIGLILGVASWAPAAAIIIVMLGAIRLAHWQWQPDLTLNGWEYCAVIIALASLLIVSGHGAFSVDALLFR